jgi:hypothetical protein
MGCILPLSEDENLPEKYGTRHRAALGLSEVTDAVCLVVSEERSEVATIVEGKIVTWHEADALANNLSEVVGGPEIRVPTLKDFLNGAFVENWRTKLSALALVTIAWLILASQQEAQLTLTVPVQHNRTPSHLMLGQGSTSTVDLTLSGRRNTIRTLRDQDVQVRVDVSDITPGRHLIKLSAKNIYLPLGVQIDQVAPQTIMVNLWPRSKDEDVGQQIPPQPRGF